jgi:hypothetical protein
MLASTSRTVSAITPGDDGDEVISVSAFTYVESWASVVTLLTQAGRGSTSRVLFPRLSSTPRLANARASRAKLVDGNRIDWLASQDRQPLIGRRWPLLTQRQRLRYGFVSRSLFCLSVGSS